MIKYLKQLWINYQINKQKKVAIQALNQLSIFDEDVLVAGGAPRDWFLGKLASDIDIYIESNTVRNHLDIISQLDDLGFKIVEIKDASDFTELYAKADYLRLVIDCLYKNQNIQIMLVGCEVIKVTEGFPLSICKIMFDRDDGILMTPSFLNGYKKKTIYVEHPHYQDEHPYVVKIRNKFPDWKYRNPYQVTIEHLDV